MGIFQFIWSLFTAYRNLRKAMGGIDRARATMQDPQMAAYIRGDYEQAKSLAQDPFVQADLDRQLGHFAEAEQRLRTLSQAQENPKLGALIQDTLGEVLVEQGRHEEAMHCFQAALRLWPERGSTYRSVAEASLRRGGDSAEALRWARLAVEKEKAGPGVSVDVKAMNLGLDLATLAWAVAVHTHDMTEVDRLAEEVAQPAITPVCTQARVNYQFGKAWAALGDSARSSAHFRHAAQVDPNGIWGKASAAMASSSGA
jgi:tetratricopeptide (TPR) repeat protein